MLKHFRKETIPWWMAAGRTMLGPVLILGERARWNPYAMAGMVILALLSDIFDGVLARRWRCDTAGVRLFDSLTDTFFYLCTAVALWIGQPAIWHRYGGLLGALLAVEAVKFAFDFAKFGKPASYHSYLAKSLGLVLASGVVATFALGRPTVLIPAALVLGILSNLEGLAMSIMLPKLHVDVKTLAAAWHLRDRISKATAIPIGLTAGLMILLSLTTACLADPPSAAVYRGGTSALARGTSGLLDLSSPTTLVFRPKAQAKGWTGMDIVAPFANLKIVTESTVDARQLGFFPMLFEGMVRTRQKRHFITVTYTDEQGKDQVAIFEVPKNDPKILCSILRVRAPESCRMACSGGDGD